MLSNREVALFRLRSADSRVTNEYKTKTEARSAAIISSQKTPILDCQNWLGRVVAHCGSALSMPSVIEERNAALALAATASLSDVTI